MFDAKYMDVLLTQITKVIRSDSKIYIESYDEFFEFVTGFELYTKTLSPSVAQGATKASLDVPVSLS